ncbi:MAG: peptidoglycan DD-metalloendopeptidase family protein [Candidatus Vogelbacteria bacterium]|nr:peptidoglycan DD-metalloendopeptidase family protein [Candidatus Vogelbacteria bacterium]
MLNICKSTAILIAVWALVATPFVLSAETIEQLQARSASLSAEIKQLDKEIATLNGKLKTTKTEKNTLSAELTKIETTRKKLLAELTKTEKSIAITNSNILKLSAEISIKTQDIGQNKTSISEALRNLHSIERDSLLELAFAGGTLSDLISRTESLDKFQNRLEQSVIALKGNRTSLETKRTETEVAKVALTNLKVQLADQKQIVEETKKEKNTLLTATKNKEANYQKLLADKLQRKEELDAEIASIESRIKIAIDPSLLPKSKGGALGYPLRSYVITQYFGNTAFAKANAAVYNGKGHNGVDFGTPTGSAVLAAESGKIVGAGDTDKTCPGASYGKWVLIEHGNGLSTLYGHLSVIKVSEGDTVIRGQTFAYSGNTGYSTGPHLHFTVYASQGVQVQSLQSKACRGVYRMPIASYNSYLNPMTYLGK